MRGALSRSLDWRSLLFTAMVAGGFGAALAYMTSRAQTLEATRRAVEPGPVVQAAPTVSLFEERTTRRQIVGTTDLVERMSDVPEPGDVVRISDRLNRANGEVTLVRRVVRRVERPVALLKSSVDSAFGFRGEVYENAFGATYEWENPTDTPAEMRFVFPPPRNEANRRGSLSGFRLTLGSLQVMDPDPDGTYSWSGTVPPHGRVIASVGYRTEGSRAYRYDPGSARLGELELRTRGDRVPSILRMGLEPREMHTTAAMWRLSDIQTEAPIAFAFPSPIRGEAGRDRALLFAPIVLAVFGLGAWLVRAERSTAATAAFGVGLVGMAVLAAYLPPTTTVLVGAAVAGVAGGKALGERRGAFVGLAGALLAAAPAIVGDFTLAVWALGLLVLGPALFRGRHPVPARTQAYVA